jgi:hypothetical protein
MSQTAHITASSNKVSQVDDLSGNGHHLVQATGANQPETNTHTINSLNVVFFDTTQVLQVASLTVSQPIAVLMVLQPTATVVVGNAQWFRGGSTNLIGPFAFANDWQYYAGSSFIDSGTTAVGDTNAQQQVITFDGASSSFYRNTVVGNTGNPGTDGLNGISVGADPALAAAARGTVGELVLMSSAIGSTDRSNWNTYCARWGL